MSVYSVFLCLLHLFYYQSTSIFDSSGELPHYCVIMRNNFILYISKTVTTLSLFTIFSSLQLAEYPAGLTAL